MALRTATLRIRVGSTSGWRAVSLSKLPRASRQTSLSRSAATLRVRWPCDRRDISPTMLPGGILGHQQRLVGAVLVLVTEHAEAAAGHDIDGVGGLRPGGTTGAARQHQQRQLALDGRHAVRLEVGEQRRALQGPAQPLSCRVLAGRDDAHPALTDLAFPSVPNRSSGRRGPTPSPAICRRTGRSVPSCRPSVRVPAPSRDRPADAASCQRARRAAPRARRRCRTRWRSASLARRAVPAGRRRS